MRIAVTLVDPRWDEREDVIIDSDDAALTGDVLDELLGLAGSDAGAGAGEVVSLLGRRARAERYGERSVFYGGKPLPRDVPIGESGLLEGALLSLSDPAASAPARPRGLVEVRVVSGKGAGAVHRLLPGEATIGSDPACVIRLEDDRLPPICATLTVDGDRVTTVAAAAGAAAVIDEATPADTVTSGLALDREPLTETGTTWPRGAQLTVGPIRLELEHAGVADADASAGMDPGWLDYNRPPRLLPPPRQTRFALPSPPKQSGNRGLPWVMVLIPLVFGVTMAMIMKTPTYLMFALMSPMMMLGNWLQGRRQGKQSYRQQVADYEETTKRIEADIEQAVIDERLARRMEAPDPALAFLIADGPSSRLWERRTTDPDYLSLRLGVGDLPSEVSVENPEELEHRRTAMRPAYDVPVTVPLRDRGVIGVAADDSMRRQIGGWMAAQLAVLQSPRDTQLYVLTDQHGMPSWEWVRWLPHVRPQSGQDTVATIGLDAETCARRIAELTAMIAARSEEARENRDVTFPDVVVIFDGARRLRTLPGVVAILKQGPDLGIRSICLDADERTLPEEANAVVLQTADGLLLRQMRVTVVKKIVPDLVDGPWLQRVSRSMAPLRDISGNETDSVLPGACRLTEVMSLEPLSADTIRSRWAMSPRSTQAVVGISLDGPFGIDMVRDGPHGLVAGTTGSGKSELLQSIVASLAVANRPDGMTFVLVDYKGGAAFKDCVSLPHTVGMVTDLDTHLVERALISLGAELNRREHILADAEAKDIEDYIDIAAKRTGMPDMPRLLIVIDEFASLARELPDFVTGLVNIAQRGRSLGIHLILATQRPSGVVSPEIRANTNLRIALRVTDNSESQDVIDAPDSGMISKNTPGRAYVRLGASSLVPFQSGRVGGRRPGAVSTAIAKPWLVQLSAPKLAQPIPTRPRVKVADDAEITDLKVLVEAIRDAHDSLGLAPQHSPWLPALDSELLLDELAADAPVPTSEDDSATIPAAPYALEDLPAQQDRRTAVIDLAEFSHLSIMGGARSGRSQALRTMAASLAKVSSPADVHLYGLDCGNGALLPLTQLPHCGAVVQRTQTDRALRLFARLTEELARRQEVLAGAGFGSLDEMRAAVTPQERLPHIVFLIDRWEGFMGSLGETNGGSPYDDVQTLLREGASVGMHLILAGDRQVVNSRLAALVEDKIGLRIPDKSDFSMIGLHPKSLPDDIPAGRGFRSESGLELQFALLDKDPAGQAQANAIRAIGAELTERHTDVPAERRPFRVDVLPGRVSFEDAWAMRPDPQPRPLWAMVGVGGDNLTALGLDLAYTNIAILAGAPKLGRSTMLMCVVESLLRGGTEVVIAAPRPSPLRAFAGRQGVRGVLTGDDPDEREVEALMEPEGPVVMVIDDGELLKHMDADDYVRTVIRTGTDTGKAVVLGGDSSDVGSGFTGWQVDVRGRQGVLIGPQSTSEGELIGVRLPRGSAGGRPSPGRGMANLGDGVLQTIQVPLPPED